MTERDTTLQVPSRDAQAAAPATRISLSRVGVIGVEKIIRVSAQDEDGTGALYHADLECFVDLNPEQAGVHMSRFEEIVNEAIDEVVLGEALRAERLAAHIAERVRERQGGLRAEVRISARYPETVPAPVSGLPTQEIYTLFGTVGRLRARHPHPHRRRGPGHDRLPLRPGPGRGRRPRAPRRARASPPSRSTEIVDAVPLATHNQRGIGTLYVGCPEDSAASTSTRASSCASSRARCPARSTS